MKYKTLDGFKDEDFRRLIGVKRLTLEKVVSILKEAEIKKKVRHKEK